MVTYIDSNSFPHSFFFVLKSGYFNSFLFCFQFSPLSWIATTGLRSTEPVVSFFFFECCAHILSIHCTPGPLRHNKCEPLHEGTISYTRLMAFFTCLKGARRCINFLFFSSSLVSLDCIFVIFVIILSPINFFYSFRISFLFYFCYCLKFTSSFATTRHIESVLRNHTHTHTHTSMRTCILSHSFFFVLNALSFYMRETKQQKGKKRRLKRSFCMIRWKKKG